MKLITGQFNDSYEPVLDGVANVTKNYAYWLNKKYGESYVVTPSFPDYTDTEDFDVIRYFSLPLFPRPPYRLGLPQLDFSINKRLEEIPFQIVHAHSPFSSGKIALKIARKRNIPIVATFHSKFYDDFKEVVKSDKIARLGVRIVIRFFNSVDYVWTMNEASAETLRSYGFKKEIEIMPNGADFTPFADLDEALEKANSVLKIQPDERVLLFVGQHIWQKNLKMLTESLQELKNLGENFKMVFVGKGVAENELKTMVASLDLADDVRFMGMIQDRDLLKSIFARANLFLFPSLYDTGGIVLQEAAAVGCPSIVIGNSNVAEQIENNYNGYYAQNDPRLFAERVREIISNPDQLARVGQNAQKTIFKDWENILDRVQNRYLEIIQYHHNNPIN